MKKYLICLWALTACAGAWAADLPCAQRIGPQLATLLGQQCRQVSPATRSSCNAAASCAAVVDAIENGCEMPRGDARQPGFCTPAERAGSFQGYLFSGGGSDADYLTVLTDRGERISAYCVEECEKLFGTDANDIAFLRRDLVGRRVKIDVAIERNRGLIPGPGEDDRIPLVKRLVLLD
jgi:hypothetical protein